MKSLSIKDTNINDFKQFWNKKLIKQIIANLFIKEKINFKIYLSRKKAIVIISNISITIY